MLEYADNLQTWVQNVPDHDVSKSDEGSQAGDDDDHQSDHESHSDHESPFDECHSDQESQYSPMMSCTYSPHSPQYSPTTYSSHSPPEPNSTSMEAHIGSPVREFVDFFTYRTRNDYK